MAALPAVTKVVRLDQRLSQGTAPNMQIREFFQYAGTLSVADATTWLHNCCVAFAAFCAARMHSSVDYVSGEMTDLTSTSAPQVLDSTGGAGTGVGTALTQGVAMVLRKHIVRRYRGGHPRVYIPGQETSYLVNTGTWAAASLGGEVGDYVTYLAACIANTNPAAIGAITHVNVSYYSGFVNHTYPSGRVKAIPALRVTPVVDAVVNMSGNPKVGSQRRRNEQST